MLIRWKSKDKSSSSQSNATNNVGSGGTGGGSSSSKKKRKGREAAAAAAAGEDWQHDSKSGRMPSANDLNDEKRRGMRREDPRRHTLGGEMLIYAANQGQLMPQRTMDLEMSTRAQKGRKSQFIRGYTPINQGPLFDDDPGIMSEVETASTGFRRGGKQRSSLPVVRTPSKTLERPLGLVFLQYRSETKRALLPNEITSIDTVRALFVRSFPRQLTMAYLEGPNVKIYIHDASKDMFYELEDVRSHLREIRDRSVLRLFESTEVAAPPQILPGGPGVPQPLPQTATPHWEQDQSYFSEPEFESDYKHQHIHKSKLGKQAPYYVGASQTLPRGMYSDRNKVPIGAPLKPLRTHNSRGSMEPLFPYTPDQLYSIPANFFVDGYTSSPERNTRGSYEEPYYSQYGTRGPMVAPIIDEEQGEIPLTEDQYALYGIKLGPGRMPRTNQMYDPTRPEELHRMRVEHMERQLANLTGLVQKALVNQNPQIAPIAVPNMDGNYLVVPTACQANGTGEDLYVREKAPKLGKNSCQKSVSFEKSVSFSDDIMGLPKSHSPQHAAESKPTKPAIKSSTLPRTSSQAERERLKPAAGAKTVAQHQQHQQQQQQQQSHTTYRADITLAPEVYNHLRGLQKKAKDLRIEARTLRRLSQAQAVAVREDIKGTFMRIRATLLASSGTHWGQQADEEATRITREEELYKQEVIRLEKDLSDLEGSVESLRGEVINRRTRVNMTAVEDMALVLSRASKTVAELKMKFPALSHGLRCLLSTEMEKVVREEKFLKEEPDRLESALRRCKKLTGTLVTLKRLASVQEQRLPPNEPQNNDEHHRSSDVPTTDKPIPTPRLGTFAVSGGHPPENALDALLDELQTFSKPLTHNNEFRPDDSTSDDSSQAIQSTVTTQIAQARLYTQNDINIQNTNNTSTLPTAGNANAASKRIVSNHMNSNTLPLHTNVSSLRRLHSYPSNSSVDCPDINSTTTNSSNAHTLQRGTKPPVPERSADLISKIAAGKRIPPPPPPRTSSRSPLASPTSPNVPSTLATVNESNEQQHTNTKVNANITTTECGSGNSSGNESAASNEHVQRHVALEMRHQELLKKQRMLQEQYQRLQQLSKISTMDMASLPPGAFSSLTDAGNQVPLLKTGSESNIQQKMGLRIAAAPLDSTKIEHNLDLANKDITASERQQLMHNFKTQNAHLCGEKAPNGTTDTMTANNKITATATTTTKQLYATEIL